MIFAFLDDKFNLYARQPFYLGSDKGKRNQPDILSGGIDWSCPGDADTGK